MKLIGWTATILAAAVLAWMFAGAESFWTRALFGLLLSGFGVLAGLRFGTQSSTSYIADLQRTNKLLCEQQRDLEEVNAILLKQINAETNPMAIAKPHTSGTRVH